MYSSFISPRVSSAFLVLGLLLGGLVSGFSFIDSAAAAVFMPRPLTSIAATRATVYSLRKLESTYSGPAINVRENSGSTTADIGFTPAGDLDTTALAAFCGTASCFVTTWYDQSGNGKNATQTTDSLQPRIVGSGVVDMSGGQPSLVFSGAQTFDADFGSGYSTFAHSAVYSRDNTTSPFGSVYHQGPGWNLGWIHAMEGNGSANLGINGESFGQTGGPGNTSGDGLNGSNSVVMGTPGIYTMNASIGNIALYLDNTLEVSATRTGVLPVVDSVRIGSWNDAETRYAFFHLSELVFYSSSLSDTDLDTFTTNEKTYYGIDTVAPVLTLSGANPQIVNQNAESIVPTTFLTGGVAQGWHADDDSWAYTLPFDFTYYGVTYASGQTIKISSNGYICLDNTQGCSSTNDTINNTGNGPFIAPLWRDLYTQNELTGGIVGNDIYLTTDTNYFTFRWQATNCCGTTDPVNFSVTIFKNGQIRFDYGDHLTPYGDTDATVGLGKGDGVNYSASMYNQGTNFDKVASSLWTSPTYYEDIGATWSDNIDGTGVILLASSGTVNVNTPGTYSITYTYRDTSGNVGSITRTVQVIGSTDVTAPVVTLVGSGSISLANGATYTELGATWIDNVDGTGTIVAASTGSVNTAVAGTYTLTYRKVDVAGNTGSTTRTVVVAAPIISAGAGGGGGGSYVAPAATQPSTKPQATTSTPIVDTQKTITQDTFEVDNKTSKKPKTLTTTTTLKNGTKVVIYRTLPNGKELKVGTARVIRGIIKYQVRGSGKYTLSIH